ncbi:MAG: Outer rane porin protein 32 [Burkholderiaceae bacterium]|nr:Outer rane porin protein 32 [Burkholderiaceae bacterium]
MKKTLIALAVLGAAAGVAHAQSNVTIYGVADIGFVKESDKKMAMGENINNRLGFMGSEDLGGGLKATFQLEQRFNLFDGTQKGNEFDGASNLGLAGASWGQVRFGRVNNLSVETIRKFDPFDQYGVGGMFENNLRSARISNTTRYDSPVWSGFQFGASYTLEAPGQATPVAATKNAGYALTLKYNNGPLALAANYDKAADSNDSNNWNLGAAYSFGPLKVSALYEQAKTGAGFAGGNWTAGAVDVKEKIWLLGAAYKVGAGVINASYGQYKIKDLADSTDKKFAIGYTHNLSKRTSVYANIAHTKYDNNSVLNASATDDSSTAYQVGMTHKF